MKLRKGSSILEKAEDKSSSENNHRQYLEENSGNCVVFSEVCTKTRLLSIREEKSWRDYRQLCKDTWIRAVEMYRIRKDLNPLNNSTNAKLRIMFEGSEELTWCRNIDKWYTVQIWEYGKKTMRWKWQKRINRNRGWMTENPNVENSKGKIQTTKINVSDLLSYNFPPFQSFWN